MADPSTERETAGPDGGSGTGTPRWVKVFGAIVLVVVVLFIVLLLTDGPGRHGPARHTGGLGTATSSASLTAPGVPQ